MLPYWDDPDWELDFIDSIPVDTVPLDTLDAYDINTPR
jgi:hypothetical protein